MFETTLKMKQVTQKPPNCYMLLYQFQQVIAPCSSIRVGVAVKTTSGTNLATQKPSLPQDVNQVNFCLFINIYMKITTRMSESPNQTTMLITYIEERKDIWNTFLHFTHFWEKYSFYECVIWHIIYTINTYKEFLVFNFFKN